MGHKELSGSPVPYFYMKRLRPEDKEEEEGMEISTLPSELYAIIKSIAQAESAKIRANFRRVCRAWRKADEGFVSPEWSLWDKMPYLPLVARVFWWDMCSRIAFHQVWAKVPVPESITWVPRLRRDLWRLRIYWSKFRPLYNVLSVYYHDYHDASNREITYCWGNVIEGESGAEFTGDCWADPNNNFKFLLSS